MKREVPGAPCPLRGDRQSVRQGDAWNSGIEQREPPDLIAKERCVGIGDPCAYVVGGEEILADAKLLKQAVNHDSKTLRVVSIRRAV